MIDDGEDEGVLMLLLETELPPLGDAPAAAAAAPFIFFFFTMMALALRTSSDESIAGT